MTTLESKNVQKLNTERVPSSFLEGTQLPHVFSLSEFRRAVRLQQSKNLTYIRGGRHGGHARHEEVQAGVRDEIRRDLVQVNCTTVQYCHSLMR